MKIRMLITKSGSPDGIRVQEYKAGEVYDLPPSLSEVFLAHGWAEQDKMLPGPSETKDEKRRGRRSAK